jgi:NAD(P)-dependent dehydrogenase (short-subunit alcohol dehydrogenase family)
MAGWSFAAGGGGAVLSVVRNLAIDLAPLRVNCIVPGLVATKVMEACLSSQRVDGVVLTASPTDNVRRWSF